MRILRRLAAEGPQTAHRRLLERPREIADVLAPEAWSNARVEAWLDWAAGLPGDFPQGELPQGLSPETPYDPLLGEGPDRYARRLAAWGWARGMFDGEDDASAFGDEVFASIALGLAAPCAGDPPPPLRGPPPPRGEDLVPNAPHQILPSGGGGPRAAWWRGRPNPQKL
jgi:ribonucleoside-diphosphate reductase alpha chain